jgi:AcrR family transcriptional regulator
VQAALQLVDDKGLAVLTMRALATELMVSPMALYNHVRDKDDLVDLMVDLMLGEVDCSATAGDWVAQLRALAQSYHQAPCTPTPLAFTRWATSPPSRHGITRRDRVLRSASA